jgi:hypothetical protein
MGMSVLSTNLFASQYHPAVSIGPVDALRPTIFHEDWWLDAATDGQVRFVEVADGNRTIGRLPYLTKTRYGLIGSNMPTLTHFLGPGIDEGCGSEVNRYAKRQSITRELIRKLPSLSSFRQKMYRGVKDALSFQAEGYEVAVQFTFEVPPCDETTLWAAMRDKTRNVIRRASETTLVGNSMEADAFFHLIEANIADRHREANVNFSICREIAAKALDLGRGRIWSAHDAKGLPKAAILCVWDAHSCYYLMSTRRADSGNGAIPLLIWHAIKWASQRGLLFDFDGVAGPGSILLFSGFGGATAPRYIVSKVTTPYKILRKLRRLQPDIVNRFN